jgi:F-type H+-transporting ATPase subunit b
MNIPLNIDWQQILLHLLNFAILAAGLYFLLYKPVKKFMDKRSAYYKQMDDEANKKLENANSLEKTYQEKLNSAEEEISNLKAVAEKEAEKSSQDQLQNAKKEAEKIVSDAKLSAENEKEKIISSAQKEIAKLTASAVEKLAQKSLESSYDEFLSATQESEENGEKNKNK